MSWAVTKSSNHDHHQMIIKMTGCSSCYHVIMNIMITEAVVMGVSNVSMFLWLFFFFFILALHVQHCDLSSTKTDGIRKAKGDVVLSVTKIIEMRASAATVVFWFLLSHWTEKGIRFGELFPFPFASILFSLGCCLAPYFSARNHQCCVTNCFLFNSLIQAIMVGEWKGKGAKRLAFLINIA